MANNQEIQLNSLMTLTLPLMDEKEAANLIGKSVSALQKDRFYGRGLPFIKLGRAVRYRPEDVAEYCLNHRVVPNVQ